MVNNLKREKRGVAGERASERQVGMLLEAAFTHCLSFRFIFFAAVAAAAAAAALVAADAEPMMLCCAVVPYLTPRGLEKKN